MLWYSLEAPHRGASNKYPQHIVSWRNKTKINLISSYRESSFIYKYTSHKSPYYEDTFSRPKAPNTRSKNVLDLRLYSTISRHKAWKASVTSVTSSDVDNSTNGHPISSENIFPVKERIVSHINILINHNFTDD